MINNNNWNLIIFLIKLVIVVLTLSSALFVRAVDAAWVGTTSFHHPRLSSSSPLSSPSFLTRFENIHTMTSSFTTMAATAPLSAQAIPTEPTTSNSTTTITATTTPPVPRESCYTPSQVVVDDVTGERWRLCAGVAVLNSRNELLMAERLDRPGQWQCPQGGVDDVYIDDSKTTDSLNRNNNRDTTTTTTSSSTTKKKETILDAAIRELYEETGLVVGQHVLLDPYFPIPSIDNKGTGIRYSTLTTTGKKNNSNNWLTNAGFAGQELHWTIFRCIDGKGDFNPNEMCNLSGQNNSHAEFSQVSWKPISDAISIIWEGKRGPYLYLQTLLNEHGSKWSSQQSLLNFEGIWERDSTQSINIISSLQARGLSEEEAIYEANQPYIQQWERMPSNMDDDVATSSSWKVTTFDDDGETKRRTLEYRVGAWTETYVGKSTMFGESPNHLEPVVLNRFTSYFAEQDAIPIPMAHVTLTDGPKGREESRRYLVTTVPKSNDDDDDGTTATTRFVLRRTFWSKTEPNVPVVSTEVFTRRSTNGEDRIES